ncbi:LysR family transcriptional regulator [Alphaproteobacteria bacterium]|jgi:DNA-binding transcriptional LysR family regulator|nr:LysR family transcriptional regulator [Alphaproteobacteria bacterium]MDC6452227.1 LysR family transcriptional regulator [Alphaproteobacteria bacterium]
MRYNLITLDLFLCASKYKSLVKAAKEKNLVVSAVSKRILDLEKSVGVNLFYRKKTGVELTPAGLEMQKHCTKIFNSINIMDESIKEYSLVSSGIVRVTANLSSITQFLPEDLATFSKKFPKIKINLKEKTSSEIISSVKESLSDIGIFSEHVENTERLRIVDYKNDTLVLVVPEYHPLVSKLTVKIKDFIKFEMVGLEKGSSLQAMIDKQVQKQNLKIKKKLETVSFEGIRGMVEAGLGISVLPTGAIKPYLKSSKLKIIKIDEEWAKRSIKIAIKNDDSIGKAGALLLNHLIS